MQLIDLNSQYRHLKSNIDKRIYNVLEHGQYIMGPEVTELEEKLAEYVGVKHVISCANGTDALQLALMAIGVKPGDAVFCPNFTFFASSEAISFIGAEPVFVDVNYETFNLCPIDLKDKIESVLRDGRLNIKAVMTVDLFGQSADYPEISKLIKEYDLKLIEDAAQGFGGSINKKKNCSFGDIATTSFFPAKPLGCYGDGGALFTDSDSYAELIRSLRIHGKGINKYDNVRIGMNSRLDTIQAAILLEKLKAFPDELCRREECAAYYGKNLGQYVEIPLIKQGYSSAWAQYTIKSNDRDVVSDGLKKMEVPHAIYYARTMTEQTANSKIPVFGSLKSSEQLTSKVLSLPMHPFLSRKELDKVIEAVKGCLTG